MPGSARFALQLASTTRAQPTDPRRLKEGAGSVSIAWSDSTSSTGGLKARARDHKIYVLEGTVDSGRFAGYKVDGWVNLPADPCQPASTTGEITFLPPNPI